MRFPIIALAAVVAFLASLDASSLLVQASNDKLSSGRSLRIAAGAGFEQDEERGSLVTKIRTTLSKKARVDEWAKAEKSDDFVLKALKLENVAKNNLWATKNYPLYLRFLEKAEPKKISNWLRDDVSTYGAWVKLGLNSIDDIDKAKRATALNTYKKFVTEYDNKAITLFMKKKIPVPVATATSPTEMNARMDALGAMERGESYARHVLGLNKLNEGAIMEHANYKYLERFRSAEKKAKKSNMERLPTIAER